MSIYYFSIKHKKLNKQKQQVFDKTLWNRPFNSIYQEHASLAQFLTFYTYSMYCANI